MRTSLINVLIPGRQGAFSARAFGLLSSLLLTAGSLCGATINLNTGVAAWTGSGPNVVGTVPAANLGASPNVAWLTAPAGSQWVGTLATDGLIPPSTSALAGTYLFSLSFNTDGLGGSLDYLVAADNQVTVAVLLDGVTISTFAHPGNAFLNSNNSPGCSFIPVGSAQCTPDVGQGMVGPGAIVWGAGGVGVLSLQATVVNSVPPDPSPVGFLLTGAATSIDAQVPRAPAVPEPATWVLVGSGLGLFGAARSRSRREEKVPGSVSPRALES